MLNCDSQTKDLLHWVSIVMGIPQACSHALEKSRWLQGRKPINNKWGYTWICYKVGPPFRIAKLVQISATTMISGTYNYSSWRSVGMINQLITSYNWGGATYNRDRDIMGIKPSMYTTRINDNWVRLNMKDWKTSFWPVESIESWNNTSW